MKDSNIICALVCCHESDKVMLLLHAFQGRADGISKGRAESSEKRGKSGKGLEVLDLNSHSHWNSSCYWRWQCRSWGRGFRITFIWDLHSSSSHLDVQPGYQKLNVLFGWLCSCVFPFLFPPLCQMSPPATSVMRCHMHGVGSVPEFTDFGTRRDLSVIEPNFLHSPGHPAPHHCVSTEPNPWSLAQLPPSAQCWAPGPPRTGERDVWGKTWRNCVEVWKMSSVQQSEICHLSVLWTLGAEWRDLCLELCFFVHYFVKIPKSGEAQDKRTLFFKCAFVWSRQCEFPDKIISLSFIYNVRCFGACFAEATLWSSPSLWSGISTSLLNEFQTFSVVWVFTA